MMYTPSHQYVHYHKNGSIYFFYKVQRDLFLKVIKDHKTYTITKISHDVIDYSVDIDDIGLFHLIMTTTLGELKYYVYNNHQWDCIYLIKCNIKSNKFRYPKIFIFNDTAHILFTILTNKKSEIRFLKLHYLNKESWINNSVCDVHAEKYDMPYYADIDTNGNIHIIYKSLIQKKHQIFYSKYLTSCNTWSTPLRISNLHQGNMHPFIFCDSRNCVHLTWSTFQNNNLQIHYINNKKANTSNNNWTNVYNLSKKGTNCTTPLIMQIDTTIKIVWKQNERYYMVKRDLLENSWNPPKEVTISNLIKLSPTTIIGNTYKKMKPVKIPMTFSFMLDKFFSIGLDAIFYDKISKPQITTNPKKNNPTTKMSQKIFLKNTQRFSEIFHSQINKSNPLEKIPVFLNNNKNITPKNNLLKFRNERKCLDKSLKNLTKTMKIMTSLYADLNNLLDTIYKNQNEDSKKIDHLIRISKNIEKKV